MTDNNAPKGHPDDDPFEENLDDLELIDDLSLEDLEALESFESYDEPIEDPQPSIPASEPSPPEKPAEQKRDVPPPSRVKAIVFAAIILFVCFIASFALTIPDTAKNILSQKLSEAGFYNARIENVSLGTSSVQATNIRLDQDGFDTIKSLHAKISWPSFLLSKDIKTLEINDLVLTREGKDFRYLMQQAINNLLKLPQTRTVLKNATFDVSTAFGDLRFVLDATIDKPKDDDTQLIQARLRAEQYQLGFDSNWTGVITKDNKISLSSEFVDGKIHFGPLNITRYNGWIAIETGAQTFSIQTQIDAGGASLFGVPLQNVSLVADIGTLKQTMIFRASMGGMPDTVLAVDMALGPEAQNAQIVLKGDDLGALLFQAEQARQSPKRLNEYLKETGPFLLSSRYQPESRFAGGPLPFLMEMTTQGKTQLSGNYLFYFDEMDVRGSLETDPKMLSALRDHFKIDEKLIDGNFIRLDGSIKELFLPAQN